MSLPRRVPWSSQEEYEEVFSLLFSSNGDLEAQRRAVDRVRDLQKLHTKTALGRTQSITDLALTSCVPFNALDPRLAVSRMLSVRCRGDRIASVGHHERRLYRPCVDIRFPRRAQTGLRDGIDSVSVSLEVLLWPTIQA